MARRPRLQFPGAVYHVMARGNRKHTIFHDTLDYARFVRVVAKAVRLYEVRIFAYCLMPNHYHLVLDTPRGNLSEAMQYINGLFARISNGRYGLTGHLFGERFRSLLIEREGYLKRAVRYVVRNPVRAGIVSKTAEWPWSSYRSSAGLEAAPVWLQSDWIQWAFRADTLHEGQRRYISYVQEPRRANKSGDPRAEVYGSPQFRARVAEAIRERQSERAVPRVLGQLNRPPLDRVFVHATGSRRERDRAIHRARVEHGYRIAEIARFLTVHPSTVSRVVQRLS